MATMQKANVGHGKRKMDKLLSYPMSIAKRLLLIKVKSILESYRKKKAKKRRRSENIIGVGNPTFKVITGVLILSYKVSAMFTVRLMIRVVIK
jgi:hypothetical protein